jgi:hypothetical protein
MRMPSSPHAKEAQNDKPADPVRVPSRARFCATGTLVGVSES